MQQALCTVVRECKNFKVRINAALAFSVPANRGCYGNPDQFVFIWDSLLVALDNAGQVSDFAEYRYRDHFTEQASELLNVCICNLIETCHKFMYRSVINFRPEESCNEHGFTCTCTPYFQVVRTLSHLLGVMDVNDMDLLGPVISSRHELLVKHVDRYKQIRSSSRKPTGQFVPRIKSL